MRCSLSVHALFFVAAFVEKLFRRLLHYIPRESLGHFEKRVSRIVAGFLATLVGQLQDRMWKIASALYFSRKEIYLYLFLVLREYVLCENA